MIPAAWLYPMPSQRDEGRANGVHGRMGFNMGFLRREGEEGERPKGGLLDLAVKGQDGQAYNEAAFRYFLAIERKRARLSRRPFLLVLVDVKKRSEAVAPMDVDLVTRLFAGLWRGLRETDFVGWYREGRVAGAVLTQLSEPPGIDVSQIVTTRVNDALNKALPRQADHRLQVRVYRLPANGRTS